MCILTPVESIQFCMLPYTTMCYKSQKKAAKLETLRQFINANANYSFLQGFSFCLGAAKLGSIAQKRSIAPRCLADKPEAIKNFNNLKAMIARIRCYFKLCGSFFGKQMKGTAINGK